MWETREDKNRDASLFSRVNHHIRQIFES